MPSPAGSLRSADVDIISSEAFARLHPVGHHPDVPQRLEALLRAFPHWREPRTARVDEVRRCHDDTYVELVRSLTGQTWLDADTPVSETTFEAALLAAGAAIDAVEQSGFALARPPGHHALPGRGMGFCIFNSAAIAARHARVAFGIERVAILDWDVHHGNGTQAIFWDDPSVLYVSLHQWPFYPGTGGPDEQSENTVNIPLPAGCGDDDYLDAFLRVVEPAMRRFEPDLLIVSAGFDAHVADPLAGMRVTENGFRELARRSGGLAPRVAAVLEGGYNVATLPALVSAALEGFADAGSN